MLAVHQRRVSFGFRPSGSGVTNYLGCAGFGGLFTGMGEPQRGVFRSRSVCRPSEITDGLSNSLLLGEVLGDAKVSELQITTARHSLMSGGVYADRLQRQPGDDPIGPAQAMLFRSRHSGFVTVALADGAVRRLSDQMDTAVLASLGAIADGRIHGEY